MKYFKFLVLFVVAGIFQGCPLEGDSEIVANLTIINNSDEMIVILIKHSNNEVIPSDFRWFEIKDDPIPVDGKFSFTILDDMNQKLWFLFYKQSTLNNHTWEEIQENNIYDARYSFTLEELRAMNWELVYDGE